LPVLVKIVAHCDTVTHTHKFETHTHIHLCTASGTLELFEPIHAHILAMVFDRGAIYFAHPDLITESNSLYKHQSGS
jgi:hypothetical protein